jgi:hypothetical protein
MIPLDRLRSGGSACRGPTPSHAVTSARGRHAVAAEVAHMWLDPRFLGGGEVPETHGARNERSRAAAAERSQAAAEERSLAAAEERSRAAAAEDHDFWSAAEERLRAAAKRRLR